MNQPDLFAGPIVQRGDSIIPRSRRDNVHTSENAAVSMIGGSHRHRVMVLTCLVLYGPQTFHEIAARTGLDGQQVNKRLPELKKQGTIDRITIATWDRKSIFKTRNSPSGRACAVWRVL